MAGIPGRWTSRPTLKQIEKQATLLIEQFRQRLTEAGLEVPSIPPVPAEYLALTITDLSVRGVAGLNVEGKSLAGLLDPMQAEICYEEADPPGRQTFSIAHELGHYFLHYQPLVTPSNQPSLFDQSPSDELLESERTGYFRAETDTPPETTRFFRCSETDVSPVGSSGLNKAMLADLEAQAQIVSLIKQKERAARLEWEANTFASGLLMPRELMRLLHEKYREDVAAIATELGVTRQAVLYRLNWLGLRHDENMGMRPKSKKKPPQQGTFF